MSTILPPNASLDRLKKQAKSLLKAHKAGDPSCCGILRHLPQLSGKADPEILAEKIVLREVQQALAQEYGFKSWAKLRDRFGYLKDTVAETSKPEESKESTDMYKKTLIVGSVAIAVLATAVIVVLAKTPEKRLDTSESEIQTESGEAAQDQPTSKELSDEGAAAAVVRSVPDNGDESVSSDLKEIQVTFSKKMTDGRWSWVGGGPTFPKLTGSPYFTDDLKTCVLPVSMEPGKFYQMRVNSPRHQNFVDASGKPSRPYYLHFSTASADGKATPIKYPKIISAFPENGDMAVDPSATEFFVTFDQDMSAGMSWCGRQVPSVGSGKWDADKRTCRIPVKLVADKEYTFSINSRSYRNFCSEVGVSVAPVVVRFKTAALSKNAERPPVAQ